MPFQCLAFSLFTIGRPGENWISCIPCYFVLLFGCRTLWRGPAAEKKGWQLGGGQEFQRHWDFSSWLLNCSLWGALDQLFQTEAWIVKSGREIYQMQAFDKTCFKQKPVTVFQFWMAVVTGLPLVLSFKDLCGSPTKSHKNMVPMLQLSTNSD